MAEIVKKAVLDIDGKASITTIRELQKELKQAKDNMVGLEEGSDAFLEAANKAGELKHQLDAINQATRASSKDFGDLMANTAKVGAGMVGAFQSVKGAMTLLGVESENVGKAIEKMQASMAVIQGLQSIDSGIKSFKTLKVAIDSATRGMSSFKKALIATGLGAFVVIVGELIAHFDDLDKLAGGRLTKTMDGLKGVFNNLGTNLKNFGNIILQSVIMPFKNLIDITEGIGKILKAVFTGDFASLGDIAKEVGADLADNFTAISDAAVEFGKGVANSFNEGVEQADAERKGKQLEEYRKQTQEKIDLEVERAKATIDNETELNKRLLELEMQRLSLYDKGTKEYYQQLQKIKQLQKKTAEETAEEVQEVIDKWSSKDEEAQMKFNYIFNEQQLREQLDQGLIDIETFNQRKLELDTAYYEDYQTLQQSIFENESLSYSERLTAYQNFLKSKEEQTRNAADNMAASNTTAASSAEGDWGKSFNSITKVTTQAFSSMSSIVSAFADSQDKNSKEGFEANKKAQIALATFSMLSGILQAIQGGNAMAAQLGLGAPAGWAMGAAMAAATAATGAINIAKIAQTKFGDKASGGSSAPSTSQAAIQSIQAPVQYTQDIQGTSIEEAIKDTRVYVVESDITDTQNKVDVAESESRF